MVRFGPGVLGAGLTPGPLARACSGHPRLLGGASGTPPATRPPLARRLAIVLPAVVCAALGACVPPPSSPPIGDLPSARLACNQQYPPKIGNYLPNAHCVNAAIERFAVPGSRHPEIIRIQQDIRAKLADQVDRRRITLDAGKHRMSQADALVAEIQRDRDRGNEGAAARRTKALDAMR